MKSINLLFTILLATSLAFGQSFQMQNLGASGITDTLVVGQVGWQTSAVAKIKNISGTAKNNVLCKRQFIYMVTGNTNFFCFGTTCYGATDNVSTHPDTIAAGANDISFVGYLNDASNSLISDTIRYTVFDGDNPSDSVSWVVVYAFTTGINELANAPKNILHNAFPDPSDNASMVKFSIAKDAKIAKINVMNMIGNKVAEYNIDTKESKFLIPTSNLNSGIYFYSLEVDGRVTSTKKLMVNH